MLIQYNTRFPENCKAMWIKEIWNIILSNPWTQKAYAEVCWAQIVDLRLQLFDLQIHFNSGLGKGVRFYFIFKIFHVVYCSQDLHYSSCNKCFLSSRKIFWTDITFFFSVVLQQAISLWNGWFFHSKAHFYNVLLKYLQHPNTKIWKTRNLNADMKLFICHSLCLNC